MCDAPPHGNFQRLPGKPIKEATRDKVESGLRRERERWRIVLDQQTNTIQKGGYAISKDTVVEARNPEKGTQDDLTDLLREGAKRLIIEAVDAELSATLAEFDDYKDEAGHRHVVRKGYFPYEKG